MVPSFFNSSLLAIALTCLVAAGCTGSSPGPGQASGSGGNHVGTGGGSGSGGAVTGSGGAASGGSGGAAMGGSGGATSDASVNDVASDMTVAGTDGGGPAKNRTGMKSVGCGKQPMGANSTSFTNHRIAIPPCAACTIPNCPKDCIAPPFATGGRDFQMTPNGETFLDRDYTIQLPANYDPTHAYPVYFGANGCGPQPPLAGAAFSVPGENNAIKVGLQQVSLQSVGFCFADGGIRCTPDIKNVADCRNGPEIPYFLAVQNWVEANFCVDLGSEYAGGGSSGAWEALLVGCASSNTLRGTYNLAGGLRENRWACNGPMATFMIVSDLDQNNPVGPLPQIFTIEDSFGAAPARDELLVRNGCVGKVTAPYDPKYPSCVKYTGCPAAYPVIWCEFKGGSHDNPNYNGVNYLEAVAPFFASLPPAP